MLDLLNTQLADTSELTCGLSSAEAKRRLETGGENVLAKKKRNSVFKIFQDNFTILW